MGRKTRDGERAASQRRRENARSSVLRIEHIKVSSTSEPENLLPMTSCRRHLKLSIDKPGRVTMIQARRNLEDASCKDGQRRRARWNTCQCVNADKEAHQGKIKLSQVSRMTKRSHGKRRVTPVRVPCLQLASSTLRVVPPCDLGQQKLDNLNERHLHTTQEASKATYFPANSPRLRTAQDLSLVSVFLEADGNASE